MKFIITFLVVICVNINPIFAQVNPEFSSITKKQVYSLLKLKKELPIQIGIEFGLPVKMLGENFFTSGIFGFLNIHLSNRNLFLKIEYANLWQNKQLIGNTATYAAISITGQLIDISKISKLYVDFGYGFHGNENYYGGGVKMAVSYIQSLNDLTSVFASVKIPLIREARNNEFYFNPFLTIGVQLF